MKVLLIDNESNDPKKLQGLLAAADNTLHIAGTTSDVASTADWLNQNPAPDLILVNKELASENLFSSVGKKYKTIVTFTTDSGDYSFEAFRFNSSLQIFKDIPDLKMHILPDMRKYQKNGTHKPAASGVIPETTPYKERFLVKQGQKLVSIHVDFIAYFLSDERFIFFKTFDNQKYLTEFRMDQLESIVDPKRFFRVNRSHFVSINAVQQIQHHFGSRLKLFLDPKSEKEVLVSRERVSDFKYWLGV
jgi:two-component system, LytTR family, response regulator LytT